LIANPLPSWKQSTTSDAIIEFVRQVTDVGGPNFVRPQDRVAVFDNDGTLWCEKPMPIQADYLLRRLGEMVEADPSLAGHQPWKAVAEHNYAWLTGAITKHYHGDDEDLRQMAAGISQADSGGTIQDFEDEVASFLQTAQHPTAGRPYLECAYQPMIELLHYLDAHGFTCYIASGGGRDFMRPITEQVYGIPPERVIGSTVALTYDPERRSVVRTAELDIFDDGPEKVVRIWSRVGKRPIFACGNSNGDIEMLEFVSGSQPALDLLILHDDSQHEFNYVAGAEKAVDKATRQGWTIVSMKNDWETVFPT
jgi:phosphoserine phosphatase